MGINYNYSISSETTAVPGQDKVFVESNSWNDGGFVSDENYNNGSPTVVDANTGDRRHVSSVDDLNDDDIITVAGVPMTVRQALDVGIDVSGKAAATFGQPNPVSQELTKPDNVELVEPVDATASLNEPSLDTRQEGDGAATDAEIVAHQTTTESFKQFTGLSADAQAELAVDVLTGELTDDDSYWAELQGGTGIHRDDVKGAVNNVVDIATRAAVAEMGQDGFNELNSLAAQHKAVRDIVFKEGINRMTKGRGVGWKQVLTLARRFANS